MTVLVLFVSLIVCLCLSAFFSGSEMAYSSANRIRLENLAQNGNRKAGRALAIVDQFDQALSTILIGNNLVNIASSSIGSVIVYYIFNRDSSKAYISTIVVTLLVIIFGETVPKITAKKNSTKIAMDFSLFLSFLMKLLKPVVNIVVFLVNAITDLFTPEEDEEESSEESVEELQSIIETAETEGIIDQDDSQLIQNAIDFPEIPASQVMTARVDMYAIDIDDSWEEILNLIDSCPYSRIPVYEDSIDNIIGILHLNNFFSKVVENNNLEFDIRQILLTPCFVYKTMKLPSVLKQIKAAKQHLAIVTDEYSGTLGIITLEDVLEQIVGEIWDETDTIENDVVKKNENVFELDGDISISEFLEFAEIEEDEFDAQSETLGGWVIETLEHFPVKGDFFEFRNMKIKVTKVNNRRVDKVLVIKN